MWVAAAVIGAALVVPVPPAHHDSLHSYTAANLSAFGAAASGPAGSGDGGQGCTHHQQLHHSRQGSWAAAAAAGAASSSPLLMAQLQDFSWTEAGLRDRLRVGGDG